MVRDFALIPAAVTGKLTLGGDFPPIWSAFTYMFLHGGWSHIIGNMLFLWVYGDNIEDAFGSVRFFFFYMICGAAGGIAHLLSTPDSVIPLVGASGAVSGVVAAYLMLRPCAKITVLLFGFIPLGLGSAWVLGVLGAGAGLERAQRRRRRHRLVGPCRRPAGRGGPDTALPPAGCPAVRVHAPGRRDRSSGRAFPPRISAGDRVDTPRGGP